MKIDNFKWFYALPTAPSYEPLIVKGPITFDYENPDFTGPYDTFAEAKREAIGVLRTWIQGFQDIKAKECTTWD